MTTYELAISIPKEQRDRMVASGLLSRSIERDLRVYELFRHIVKIGTPKMDAYTRVSIECCTCEENVRRIVRRMNREAG